MAADSNDRFDPRLTPARPDLAAKHLEGQVAADRFVAGELREVIAPQAPLRRAPAPDAPLGTEALRGERVTVYETNDEGWCWAQLASDGYVGWLPENALTQTGAAPTHRVATLRTLVFPGIDIKSPPIDALPFGSRLAVVRDIDRFAIIASGGHVPAIHLVPVDRTESDFVAVAERFIGTPYLWGGKTNLGLDCSGLVQIALGACGISCPRDSDMQETALGEAIALSSTLSNLRRGDLLFWNGHVGIVQNLTTLLHANAFHMAVVAEPLDAVVRRIADGGVAVRAAKRLAALGRGP